MLPADCNPVESEPDVDLAALDIGPVEGGVELEEDLF
jgi:hypothetical protein